MKRQAIWGILLIPILAAMAVGWTDSLQPIYTDEDIIYEPGLCGTWQMEEDDSIFEIAPSADVDQAYVFSFSNSEGNPSSFLVHLVELGDYMFLDFYPPKSEETDMGSILNLQTHAYVYVEEIEPDLIFRDLDKEWFDGYVKEHPDELRVDIIQNEYVDCSSSVITASTAEIQAFMIEHLDTEGAYGDPVICHRAE